MVEAAAATSVNYTQLSRRTRLQRPTVKYRIDRMMEAGTLRPTCLVDPVQLFGPPLLLEIEIGEGRMTLPGELGKYMERLASFLSLAPHSFILRHNRRILALVFVRDDEGLEKRLIRLFNLSPRELKLHRKIIPLHPSRPMIEPQEGYFKTLKGGGNEG